MNNLKERQENEKYANYPYILKKLVCSGRKYAKRRNIKLLDREEFII